MNLHENPVSDTEISDDLSKDGTVDIDLSEQHQNVTDSLEFRSSTATICSDFDDVAPNNIQVDDLNGSLSELEDAYVSEIDDEDKWNMKDVRVVYNSEFHSTSPEFQMIRILQNGQCFSTFSSKYVQSKKYKSQYF